MLMNLGLAVWYSDGLVGADEARRVYGQLTQQRDAGLPATPAIAEFYRDLRATFPESPGPVVDPLFASVWLTEPEVTDRHVLMSVDWENFDHVIDAVLGLARNHGLVVYDPQESVIHYPTPPGGSTVWLETSADRRVANPDPAHLDKTVRRLRDDLWFVSLERQPQVYLQAATGPHVWLRFGQFQMEHRDGSGDYHFRTYDVSDVESVLAVFREFATGVDDWKSRYDWQRVDL